MILCEMYADAFDATIEAHQTPFTFRPQSGVYEMVCFGLLKTLRIILFLFCLNNGKEFQICVVLTRIDLLNTSYYL